MSPKSKGHMRAHCVKGQLSHTAMRGKFQVLQTHYESQRTKGNVCFCCQPRNPFLAMDHSKAMAAHGLTSEPGSSVSNSKFKSRGPADGKVWRVRDAINTTNTPNPGEPHHMSHTSLGGSPQTRESTSWHPTGDFDNRMTQIAKPKILSPSDREPQSITQALQAQGLPGEPDLTRWGEAAYRWSKP